MKAKYCLLGALILFLIPLLYSPPNLGSIEKTELNFRPGNLYILEEENERNSDYDDQVFAQGSKGIIVVFAVNLGYEDKNGTRHFPASRLSLQNTNKVIIRIDFKVHKKNAKVGVGAQILGPVIAEAPEDELIIDAKRNTIYQQELILDLTEEGATMPPPGLYEIIGAVYPSLAEIPMLKSGGMTFGSTRGEIKN